MLFLSTIFGLTPSFITPPFVRFQGKYSSDFERGLLANANTGGENVHRGIVLGALLGAQARAPARACSRAVAGIRDGLCTRAPRARACALSRARRATCVARCMRYAEAMRCYGFIAWYDVAW